MTPSASSLIDASSATSSPARSTPSPECSLLPEKIILSPTCRPPQRDSLLSPSAAHSALKPQSLLRHLLSPPFCVDPSAITTATTPDCSIQFGSVNNRSPGGVPLETRSSPPGAPSQKKRKLDGEASSPSLNKSNISPHGCSRGFILCVLHRALCYVSAQLELGSLITYPFNSGI